MFYFLARYGCVFSSGNANGLFCGSSKPCNDECLQS
jgi:hypothetical protein